MSNVLNNITLNNGIFSSVIIPTATNNITLSLPISTDTLVGRNTTDILLNKTINSTTNTVGANVLYNGSTWNVPIGGAAPTADQVLSFDGVNVVWSSSASVVTGKSLTL